MNLKSNNKNKRITARLLIAAISCFFIIAFSSDTLVFAQQETRQIPGQEARPTNFPPFIYESVPDINSSASEFITIEDRWRQFYVGKWYDPYNQNVLKGDIPVLESQVTNGFLKQPSPAIRCLREDVCRCL